ncbi:hypothetical protein FEM48_Zijuj01G0266500 [Ziziphus jujuba var. spinosa]|uniref:Disease resistance protein RPM1-like n=1 Tax=Ziziphus jujuba var. spinosa TaxID=714518 RepID=A0A978W521_ZIZJJ|nr:hypothetical protein FEM48_Zijuj01G0266500 [Ziziphus jujuba var. spinosa]
MLALNSDFGIHNSMEAVTQLTDAIQKLENNMSDEWKTGLGELRKQYSELLAEYQFNESSFTDDFREVLPLAHSVEADAYSILCRREKKMSGFLGLFNSLMNKAMDENISNRKIIEKLFEGESKLKQKFCLVFCRVELEGKKVHRVYNLGGFVSILGDEGPTKTTVARKIYEAAKDQNKFEICAWVTVLPKHDMRNIYTTIAEQQDWRLARTHLGVEIEELHNLSLEDLISKVNQWLKSCSFIVVFDGCDNFSSRIILRCLSLFVMGTRGTEWSTVIFTTSNAQMSDVTRVIEIVKWPISFQEGWELFTNTYTKEDKDKLEQVGAGAASINQTEKELLMGNVKKMSTDSPQAITMLPRLYITNKLRLKKESSYTVSALTSWDRQYQLLPPRIRLCYLYMGLFPEAYEIPIRRLFKLWIAEGLVIPDLQSSEATPPALEDLAMIYLEELEKSQMIFVKLKNERPRTCRIASGDMHKFFSRKAMDLGTFYVHKSADDQRPKFSVARLAQHDHDIKSYNNTSDDHDHYMQHLRSYISFNTRKRDTPAQEVGDFLDKLVAKRGFGLLRVLDLENVYRPKLPEETLEKLFLLAYLGLRWTFLDSLPDSVGALQYLETLDVKHTNITTLPTTIWKAKSLRHLYMNQVHFDTSNKKGFINSLATLQTLWGLSIGSNSHVVKWLSKLSSLRKLGLTYVYHPKTAEEIANWVSKLTNLQSLRLRSLDQSGKPSCLKLPDMGDLAKLSELYLVGVLSNFKSMSEIKFPPKLEILTLTGSQLQNDDLLQKLGELSNLKSLKFYGRSYSGSHIIIDTKQFAQLAVIKLWVLEKLESLEIKEGAMPNLKELDIRCCHNLKYINGQKQHSYSDGQIIIDTDPFPRLAVIKLWELEKLEILEIKGGAMPNLEELDIGCCHNLKEIKELKQLAGGLKKMTLTSMSADFVERVESEVDKKQLAVDSRTCRHTQALTTLF